MGKTLTLIGDVHGDHKTYRKLIKGKEQTLQIGDFGFNYDVLDELDDDCHRILLGNHDNYDIAHLFPHVLKDYGMYDWDQYPLWFFRGAFSIDWFQRQLALYQRGVKSWWWQEECDFEVMTDALQHYKNCRPSIVVTHSGPRDYIQSIGNSSILRNYKLDSSWSSNTQKFLQTCLESHRPKVWIMGHMHQRRHDFIDGTHFIVLNKVDNQSNPADEIADLTYSDGTLTIKRAGKTLEIKL